MACEESCGGEGGNLALVLDIQLLVVVVVVVVVVVYLFAVFVNNPVCGLKIVSPHLVLKFYSFI